VRLEELGELKYPMTSSGFEPATFWLVRYRVPLFYDVRTEYLDNIQVTFALQNDAQRNCCMRTGVWHRDW
jgi:hypothetical protein